MQFPQNNQSQQTKPFSSEEDYKQRLELIKINKARKKQGLEPLTHIIAADNNKKEDNNNNKDSPPKAGENPNVNETTIVSSNSSTEKPYSYYQG